MTTILIPIKDSDNKVFIEVPVSELPQNAEEIIGVLRAEVAPLHVWLECAVNYYKQGNTEAFQAVLNVFTEKNIGMNHITMTFSYFISNL
jgi:RNA polymerase-associated protein CTR9